jgi:hypothetical protein
MHVHLRLHLRRMRLALAALTLAFPVLSVLTWWADGHYLPSGARQLGRLGIQLNVDQENNIPTWSSVLLLATGALLCWAMRQHVAGTGGADRRFWGAMTGVFFFLSADEAASLHELLGHLIADRFPESGLRVYIWTAPYGLLVLGVGMLSIRFVARADARLRRALLIAGMAYVGGALGVELVESRLPPKDTLESESVVALQECLEFGGASVFAIAVAEELQRAQRRGNHQASEQGVTDRSR